MIARQHYKLGVRLNQRSPLLRAVLQRRVLATMTVVIAIFGLSSIFTGVPSFGRNTETELAHKQNKISLNKKSSKLLSNEAAAASRASWLRVRPANVTTPTATPTAFAAQAAAAGQAALATADSTTATSVAAALPPVISVKSTATEPVTVSIDLPSLPTIVIPAPLDADLDNPVKKDIAMQLVSSAENSSLDWKAQYGYLEDIGDGRGYTGGIIGFCSGTGDMLELVQYYTKIKPGNALAAYLPALQKVDGASSHAGLSSGFESAWKAAANDPAFQQAQNDERDRVYFNPAVTQAKADGLRALGQFIYYDALVMHGPGNDSNSFGGIRTAAMRAAKTPAQGGDETVYLNAFLSARVAAMKQEAAHHDVGRVETAQRLFLQAGNLDLHGPLSWKSYGDAYSLAQ